MEKTTYQSKQSSDTESDGEFEEQNQSDNFKVLMGAVNAKIVKDREGSVLELTESGGMTQYNDDGIHLHIKDEALLKNDSFEEASKMSRRDIAKIAKIQKLTNLNLMDTDGRTQLDDGGKYVSKKFDTLLEAGKLDKAFEIISKPEEESIGYDMVGAVWSVRGPEDQTKVRSEFWPVPRQFDNIQEFEELSINDRTVNDGPSLSKTTLTDKRKNVISRKHEREEEDEHDSMDRSEEVSIWCSRFQSGTHACVKQRNNFLGFRMNQTCSVIKRLVHLWTMTRQNNNEMIEVLDECRSEMMNEMKKDYEKDIKKYNEQKLLADKLVEALNEFGTLETTVQSSGCRNTEEIKKTQDKKCSYQENRDVNATNTSHSLKGRIEGEELALMMNSPIVHEALNSGLTRGEVRRALQRKILHTGTPFLSTEALTGAVLGRDREYDSDSDIDNDDNYENNI